MTRLLRVLLLLGALAVFVARAHALAPGHGSLIVALPAADMTSANPSTVVSSPPALSAAPRPRQTHIGAPRMVLGWHNVTPHGSRGVTPSPAVPQAAEAAAALASITPASYDLGGPPSISVSVIEGILQRYGSPLTGGGQMIYDLGREYGIDPAFCVAFFVHESAAGTRGEAVLTRSMGNIRARAGEPARDGYRLYSSWEEGVRDWYRLMRDVYLRRWHLRTVADIIPVYAPSSDSNDVAAYISDVQTLVSDWRALSAGGA